MKNVALLASMVSALFLSGCLGCSAYNGANDTVYARGGDSLVVCGNGGFVANLSTGTIEGRIEAGTGDAENAVRGDTGQVAFQLIENTDGTATTPELGTIPWQDTHADKTALDHADVQCTDLETRAWWTASAQ